MNEIISKIDLSKAAIEQWESFLDPERDSWKKYFELNNCDDRQASSYRHFSHDYKYQLSNNDVVRVIFCAVIEILRYNASNKMNKIFIGNSGGLDSATTCGLLSKAQKLSQDLGMPFEVISYGLPISSNPDHNLRAEETAKVFNLRHVTIENLDEVYEAFKKVCEPLADGSEFNEEENRRGFGNVKARIRMIVNFFGTTKSGSYVVSTDNLSELYMAFWTLMGDVGAFGPIQNILKGLELPLVAYALGVPEQTIDAKPTDGLEVHKSLDEEEGGDVDAFKGVTYPHLDAIICHATAEGLDLEKAESVSVKAGLINSEYATQEVVDSLINQMTSPGSVWKRTVGSIGSALSREQLGLPPVSKLSELL